MISNPWIISGGMLSIVKPITSHGTLDSLKTAIARE